MPIAYPGNQITKEARSRAGGGFESAIEASGGFTPMVAEDHSGATSGQTDLTWVEAEFSDVVAKSGTTSVRLNTLPTTGDSCGGSHDYGRRRAFSQLIPIGKTVWQRFYFYLPSAFSMGYAYGNNSEDCSQAASCGQDCDGTRYGLKWLVFSPDVGGARIYAQPITARRQVSQPPTDFYSGIRINIEASPILQEDNGSPVFPRDEWFSLEMAVKVSNTDDGFVRLWQNGILLDERINVSTISSSANALGEWGIGDYWNGVPWTDGAAGRETFYIDEIIVASDLDGFGAPTETDAAGNLMIGPTTLVGDL